VRKVPFITTVDPKPPWFSSKTSAFDFLVDNALDNSLIQLFTLAYSSAYLVRAVLDIHYLRVQGMTHERAKEIMSCFIPGKISNLLHPRGQFSAIIHETNQEGKSIE
jgi:hypothetical protein